MTQKQHIASLEAKIKELEEREIYVLAGEEACSDYLSGDIKLLKREVKAGNTDIYLYKFKVSEPEEMLEQLRGHLDFLIPSDKDVPTIKKLAEWDED